MTAAVQPTRDEAIRMLRDGLGEYLQKVAASYSIPICWISSVNGKPHILDSGSCFLLDCGAGPFLVSAGHVLKGFRADKALHNDAVCLVGEVRFDLIGRVIAEDLAYDVATFRVTDDEITQLRNGTTQKLVLTGSQAQWPPAPPLEGRGVFFVGFPGDGRAMRPYTGNSEVEVEWLGYTALAIANSVSTTGITLVIEHERDFDVGLRPLIPSDWALGGCSGAPLLTFVEQNGVFSWRLGGIIYESNSLMIKASRADCLKPDGGINRFPNPVVYSNRSP